MKTTTITTIDEYLETIPESMRPALEKLRKLIKSLVPDATEAISYAIPMFKYYGNLVGFMAAKKHCSFFTCSGSLVESMKDELVWYKTSKGTIRFDPKQGLPEPLVRNIIEIRMKENKSKNQ